MVCPMSGQTSSTTAKVAPKSNRGSKPGERRGGRQKGVPNKATASLKEVAREYTEDALRTLAQIMVEGESESARVAAANAILDRGYGKPSTVLAGDEDGGAVQMVHKIVLEGVMPK